MLLIVMPVAAALQTEKFIDGRWQVVPPADRMKITQLDGQVRGGAGGFGQLQQCI